jgi:predicted nucleic acid-binding protein
VPTLVITEAAYLIAGRLGVDAEVRFLADFAVGNFIAEPVHPSDWLRIAELVKQYASLPLGAADASVIAVAERLGMHEIATLGRRDFSVVRTKIDHVVLLP